MNFDKTKFLPHLIVLLIFMILTGGYFSPLFMGEKIYQGDIVNYKGMSQELIEFRSETGEEALWTNRMFGGMPAYQISHQTPSNLTRYADKILRFNFPKEASFVLIALIGFYILLLCLGLDPWMSMVGALGFAMTSYLYIIIEAGHNTKAHAITYMAPVLGGILLAFRGRVLQGSALAALFLALQLRANHFQISYYLLIIVLLFALFELIHAIKQKTLLLFLKTASVLFFAAILGVGANLEKLLTTYDYADYSTRSKSELTIDGDQSIKTSGLNKDYATSWSYGKMETFNLMIPNFMGGASGSELSKDSETFQVLKKNRVRKAENVIKRMPTYWGSQPFTSGPVYVGSVVSFFFFLGVFLVKGRYKWWLLTCTLVSFGLAWGNNMMWLTDLFLDYLPGYNKFRTVSMILVIAELTIPLLAFLGIKELISQRISNADFIKSTKFALAISGGFCLFFALLGPTLFDFSSIQDNQLPEFLIGSIESDRASLMQSDSIRSLIFILLSALSVYLFHFRKIKFMHFVGLLAILILVDMLPVNLRYLNSDDFVKANKMNQPFKKTAADIQILADKELNFRVYNTTERLDAGARTSYFHNNIAGYHGAKLKRYQELMDLQITKGNTSVLNMLNTKYYLSKSDSGELVALRNPNRLGPAWFVKEVVSVQNADQEMQLLSSFNPLEEVIIDKRFGQENLTFSGDGSISLVSYKPNHLVYRVKSDSSAFAVFSEIFYDKGWNAYIDGNLHPHFRVNYVLRGMNLPAGDYQVEYKFEPYSVALGSSGSFISSVLIYLFLGFAVIKSFRL
ncbi:MAG: hypothetical protein CMP57_00285 [Flavobacteriales bacterium]|nr:hypothetical protein [Flavobacteriales bacterium]